MPPANSTTYPGLSCDAMTYTPFSMLPFLNVLSVGIVAAFAAIEEIPAIIEMRIDRKKAFLALSDTPPPHSFS